jgi:hypothetical protein
MTQAEPRPTRCSSRLNSTSSLDATDPAPSDASTASAEAAVSTLNPDIVTVPHSNSGLVTVPQSNPANLTQS